MSAFQEAARLNNEGIDALLQGDQSSAISSMSDSIKLMKAELSSMSATSSLARDSNDSHRRKEQNTHTVEIPSMESCDTIVFNQAIRIPTDEAERTEADITIFTCAVIFNLALAHHFQASTGDAVMMAKTEKLYAMVLKLLNSASLNVHTALIVKLASINNLSQIRYSKGDYKNAREGLKEVSSFMKRSSNQAMFEQPEIQGLLLNVLLLKAPSVARAA